MFRIVLWPPLLLCCLLCGKTMALILAFAGRQAIWQRTVPVRSTSLVQPPLLSTSPTHFSPPIRGLFYLPFCACVCGVEDRSEFILFQSGRGQRSQPGCWVKGSRDVGDAERAELCLAPSAGALPAIVALRRPGVREVACVPAPPSPVGSSARAKGGDTGRMASSRSGDGAMPAAPWV